MNIIFRDLEPNDYWQADALMQQMHNLHLQNRPDIFRDIAHPYSMEEYLQILEDDKKIKIAALIDGVLAGLCIVTLGNSEDCPVAISRPIAFIEDFCVDNHFRRHGVGGKMFDRAMELAKGHGAERLELMVWSFNEDAIRFYEKMGLTPQNFVMEKYL